MATLQQMLDDIKLRYRHSFTNDQVLVWMSEEQRELFEYIEIDGEPYQFTTVADQNFYPIPGEIEIEKIKAVTFERDSNDNYIQLDFKRNDDNVFITNDGLWYTIISDTFYIHYPGTMPADRKIYIYADQLAIDMNSSNLSLEPATPKKFQEILKLGTLERIASARKDVIMKNNYAAEKEQKISDMLWNMKQYEPEWVSPADVMPHAGGRWRGGTVAITVTQSE